MKLKNFTIISCFLLSYSILAHADSFILDKYTTQDDSTEQTYAPDSTSSKIDTAKLLRNSAVKSSIQNMSEYLQESKKYQNIARGGESSGGANGLKCYNEENIILQDYLNDDPNFFEKFSSGDFIQPSPFAQTLGYDRINEIQKFKSYALAKYRLKVWSKKSPVIISLITEAMNRMTWLYTPYHQVPARGSELSSKLTQSCYNLNLFSIVVYDARFGARISAPVWNSLGLFSQAGVLVHEALRHISHFYKGSPGEENSLTTEQIIYITKTIMTKTPSDSDSLDKTISYRGILKRLLDGHYKENPMELFCRLGSNVLADVDLSALAKYKDKNAQQLEDFTKEYSAFSSSLTATCKNQKKSKIFDENIFQNTRAELYRLKEAADDLFLTDISIHEMVKRENSKNRYKDAIRTLVQQLSQSRASLKEKRRQLCQLLDACRTHDVFLFELDAVRRELSGAYSDFLIERIGSRIPELQDLSKSARFAMLENAEIVLKKYLSNEDIDLPPDVKMILDGYILDLQRYHRDLINSGVIIKSF